MDTEYTRMQSFVAPRMFNAIKVWLQSSGMTKQTANGRQHYSPFVDLFFFNITETGRLKEVAIWESDRET